jgi:hypothetical protein
MMSDQPRAGHPVDAGASPGYEGHREPFHGTILRRCHDESMTAFGGDAVMAIACSSAPRTTRSTTCSAQAPHRDVPESFGVRWIDCERREAGEVGGAEIADAAAHQNRLVAVGEIPPADSFEQR